MHGTAAIVRFVSRRVRSYDVLKIGGYDRKRAQRFGQRFIVALSGHKERLVSEPPNFAFNLPFFGLAYTSLSGTTVS
jgi:hypothetical protein